MANEDTNMSKVSTIQNVPAMDTKLSKLIMSQKAIKRTRATTHVLDSKKLHHQIP